MKKTIKLSDNLGDIEISVKIDETGVTRLFLQRGKTQLILLPSEFDVLKLAQDLISKGAKETL